MRLLFISLFIFSSGYSQTILDSNHVYNANSIHLIPMLRGSMTKPDLINGNDLSTRCFDLIDTLLEDLKSDSLKYIVDYDSTQMYWNMVGHQIGNRKDRIAFVLTYTDLLADDFYEISVGGLFQFRNPYFSYGKWLANGLRYYFILDITTGKIIYYCNPMCNVIVSKL